MLADGENLLDGAFADEDVAAVLSRQDDRKTPAHEVEGNFVDLFVFTPQMQILADFGMLEHRHVEQILQARLVMAVQIGELQHAFAIVAANVEMPFRE